MFRFHRKLYAKALKVKSPIKRTSAKKKTPGKRKTPRSAKRQFAPDPETSRASTKRAMFTNSAEKSAKLSLATTDTSARGKLPRRTLFSPEEKQKRKRSTSPDQDAENREEKIRRISSPGKLQKSQSFSVAQNPSGSLLINNVNKRLLFRTQSDVASQAQGHHSNLGYKQPLTDTDRKVKLYLLTGKSF